MYMMLQGIRIEAGILVEIVSRSVYGKKISRQVMYFLLNRFRELIGTLKILLDLC